MAKSAPGNTRILFNPTLLKEKARRVFFSSFFLMSPFPRHQLYRAVLIKVARRRSFWGEKTGIKVGKEKLAEKAD